MMLVVAPKAWLKVKLFHNYMRLTSTLLRRLVVKTISGEVLGKIKSWEIDTDEQMIVQYIINSSPLSSRKYVVHRGQVKGFTETEMLVDDSVVRDSKPPRRRRLIPHNELDSSTTA